MKKYFTHPIVQVLSFSFILIHGFIWVPFIYAILIAIALDFKLFAFLGLLGIAICLLSNYYYKKIFQFTATILMTSSFFLYLNIPETKAETAGAYNMITLLTLLLFTIIQLASLIKLLKKPIK